MLSDRDRDQPHVMIGAGGLAPIVLLAGMFGLYGVQTGIEPDRRLTGTGLIGSRGRSERTGFDGDRAC